MVMETEIAVVGAGPAGLAAAVAASEAGCRVTLVDTYARPGGQYFKQTPAAFGATRPQALHGEWAKAARLFEAVAAHPLVSVLSDTSVWTAHPNADDDNFTLYLTGGEDGAESKLTARKVILATGAYDRVLPFPGWDLPGVLAAGGLQSLVKSQRVLPGRKIVLSGSGPFLLPVAAGLAEAGANLVGVFEATRPVEWLRWGGVALRQWDKLNEGRHYLQTLRKYGVPVRFGRAVVAAEGGERLERVTVARLTSDWTPRPDSLTEIEADTLGVGYGFLPSSELALVLGCRQRYDPVGGAFFIEADVAGRSSQAGVFVAGELSGIGGSALALPGGALAGLAAAQDLGHLSRAEQESRAVLYRREVARRQPFAQALNSMFRLRPGWQSWLRPDTTICRCEEVPYARVRLALDELGAGDVRAVKLTTRCGMGLCQGRVCGHIVTALTAQATGRNPAQVGTFANRPIVKPVTLEELIKG